MYTGKPSKANQFVSNNNSNEVSNRVNLKNCGCFSST